MTPLWRRERGVQVFTKGMRGRLIRLPEAAGADSGTTDGKEPALRMAVLGDSVAAGVGAAEHREAMAGRLAEAVSAMTGRAVSWRVAAKAGATLAAVRQGLLPGLTDPTARWRPDVVVVVAGTNDALRLRRPAPSSPTLESARAGGPPWTPSA